MIPSIKTPGLTWEQRLIIFVQIVWWALSPLFLYILIPSICMMLGMFFRGWKGTLDEFIQASGNFYSTAGIVLTMVFLWRREKKRGKDMFAEVTLDWRQPDYKKLAGYLLVGIELSILMSAILTFLPSEIGMVQNYEQVTEQRFYRTDLILVIFSLMFAAPLSEEVIFRGYMLNRFLTQFQEKTAVLLTTVIFALCHTNLIWIAYAFVIGLFLAAASIREDNILYSLALHTGFNLPSVFIILIQMSGWAESLFFQNKLLILCYGVIALLGIIVWVQKFKGGTNIES